MLITQFYLDTCPIRFITFAALPFAVDSLNVGSIFFFQVWFQNEVEMNVLQTKWCRYWKTKTCQWECDMLQNISYPDKHLSAVLEAVWNKSAFFACYCWTTTEFVSRWDKEGGCALGVQAGLLSKVELYQSHLFKPVILHYLFISSSATACVGSGQVCAVGLCTW